MDRLYADRVDTEELLALLVRRFKGAEADGQGNVFYPSSQDCAIRIHVVARHIVELEFGSAFGKSQIEGLRRQVREKLLADRGSQVERRIAFCSMPVAGHFVAPNDAFHLLPAPAEAPRPPAFFGDHPLVIEFPVKSSVDEWVTFDRTARTFAQWTWFLNAILLDTFLTPRTRQGWFLSVDRADPNAQIEVRWGNEGYTIPGKTLEPPGSFSPLVGPPLNVQAQDEYYSRRGVSVRDTLSVPDSFAGDISAFVALDAPQRDRLLRCAQWITAAHDLWGSHMSSWYIAQVAAVETLAHADGSPDRNRQPTKRFKDFLEMYAPGSGSRNDRKRLYAVRSRLVHGTAMLDHDSPFGGGLLAFATHERESMDRLSRAVTIASVNWLREQAAAP